MRRLGLTLVLLGGLAAGCSTVPARFAPTDPLPAARFSYQPLDAALRAHVTEGQVNYSGFAADTRFATYRGQLARVNPDEFKARSDKLAFWINTYNALAIQGVLEGDSPFTASGKYRYFIKRTFTVGGGALNLWGLEHRLLIPLGEPRVHFAINCASWSCPKLQSQAYLPDTLDRQLDTAAHQFINDPQRNHFDRVQKTAHLSMIFKWYDDEFETAAGSVLKYIARYVDDPLLARELALDTYAIRYLPYDWSLNGTPPR
jgi:hypothetical protein